METIHKNKASKEKAFDEFKNYCMIDPSILESKPLKIILLRIIFKRNYKMPNRMNRV